MTTNLVPAGGNTYGDKARIVAEIEAALVAGVEDDEIRRAFGLGAWRVVTDEHRARFGAVKAPLIYDALVTGMRDGLAAGRLVINKFVKMQHGTSRGELFPVTDWGPCVKAEMRKVSVTVEAGAEDYQGGAPGGMMPGGLSSLAQGWHGPVGVYAELVNQNPPVYSSVDYGDVFCVRAPLSVVLNYGGLYFEHVETLYGLLVRGVREINPQTGRYDLTITDGAPDIEGEMVSGSAGVRQALPIEGIGTPGLFLWGHGRSFRAVLACEDRAAESFMHSEDVHAMNCTGYPLRAGHFANCFPRVKWIEGRLRPKIGGGTEQKYKKVRWITRAQWMALYGADLAAGRLPAGSVVPQPLAGGGRVNFRVYAQFDPAFIDEMNPEAGQV